MLPQEAVEVAHDRIVAIGRSRHGIGKAVAILMLDRASLFLLEVSLGAERLGVKGANHGGVGGYGRVL